MKNRPPSDNTITGITENIAELAELPRILLAKQGSIDSTQSSLNALIAVECDYVDNKIPSSNRLITALSARLNMLELPVSINAIKELVEQDNATIAHALQVRSENENKVQPYLDERKKIKQAIDLHTSLLSYKSLLATASSNLLDKRAELSRLQKSIADLKKRRESADAIEIASKEKLEGLDHDLQKLRKRHRAEEEPVVYSVNQVKARLDNLKEKYRIALQHQAEATTQQQNSQKTASKHEEKSRQAYQDKTRFLAMAQAANTKKYELIADLERERSAYESAKQAAEYSNNAAATSSATNTISIPVGLGGFIQMPATSSPQSGYSSSQGGYSSSQGGNPSNSSYSSSVAENVKILAAHAQKICELDRGIQLAEEEMKRCERKAASEQDAARDHEATAATACQQIVGYGEQARTYALQASSLQSDIDRTNSEFLAESEKLRQLQLRMQNDDDRLRRMRDTVSDQHSIDVMQYNELNKNVGSTGIKIDDTNQSHHEFDKRYRKQKYID